MATAQALHSQKTVEFTALFSKHRTNAPTLGDVARQWLDSARGTLKSSTLSTYSRVAETHILPPLGSRPLSSLTPEAIGAFLRSKTYGDERLSPATVRCIASVLRGLLSYAAGRGLCSPSPESVHAPAPGAVDSRALDGISRERLEAYLLYEPTGARLGILLCMYTGLRIGEVCALKWGDVAPGCGSISVSRTVQRIRDLDAPANSGAARTRVSFDSPKSRSANRHIPLPPFISELLRAAVCGSDCFVLTGEPDRFLEPRTLQNRFKAALRDCGLPDVNFHALRHTFATRCVELGFDVKTLSRIMGHSDVSVTLNTYVHPSMERMTAMMALLEPKMG